MIDPNLLKQFEDMGPDLVRTQLRQMAPGSQVEAIAWLAQKDRDARARTIALEDEQMELARATKASASEANRLASRSVAAAHTSNKIAAAALAVAIIAIVVSIIGFVHTVRHDDAPQTQASTQTH